MLRLRPEFWRARISWYKGCNSRHVPNPSPTPKPVPFVPASAPFGAEQRAWLNGYLAGLFADAAHGDQPPTPASTALSLLVLYGSQTGTAEKVAKSIASVAARRSFNPRLVEMNAALSLDLAREERIIVVTSTWGDGDPPDNAVALWKFLSAPTAPRLPQSAFAVLALGDKNYPEFCGAGKKFDARLEALGARRLCPMGECDVDYEAPAAQWIESLWSALAGLSPATPSPAITSSLENPAQSANLPSFNRDNPFAARLLAQRPLNAPGSAKDTRHFEISLAGSNLEYEPGDALGVFPTNCPALVKDILHALGCDGEEAVRDARGQETSLGRALLHSYEITRVPTALLQALALATPNADEDWRGRDVLDALRSAKDVRLRAVDFIAALRKLQPRLYSISSSPRAHPGEVHLTVAAVRYENHGRPRKGVCSTFLADLCDPTSPLPIFLQKQPHFRLPTDGATPLIMIGPGTGVAPFRAFLEERQAVGASGRNWLFFGDQSAATDFLYRDQLLAWRDSGFLTRLDTAFSRDQSEKIYVQHRMRENSAELWSWLEAGAHVYVCGDAKKMARDVDAELHAIVQSAGGKSADQAASYIDKLRTEKRYQRDVY